MHLPSVRRALVAAVAVALFVGPATAQICPSPSDTFWKNDILPDNPATPQNIAVVPGVCEGEAVAQYFQLAPGQATQRIKQVAVGFGHSAGTGGFQAVLNVEIYEGGVTFNPNGTAVLGTKVFDLAADTGQSMQVTSTSINSFDMTPYNVEVSDDFVVAFRMDFNVSFPGCPPGGANANFFTAGTGCAAGSSLLDVQGTGWVDPTQWSVLCPIFYRGQWVIRACTEDVGGSAGTWDDLGGGTVGVNGAPTLAGSGTLVGGQPATLLLTNAPQNGLVLAWFSLQSNPINALGGTVYPVPFTNQLFFFTNFLGSLQLQTLWPVGVPSGTQVWFQFLLDDPSVIHGITLSNAVKATTP